MRLARDAFILRFIYFVPVHFNSPPLAAGLLQQPQQRLAVQHLFPVAATALGVYQRAMSSLARASRAAASLRSTLRHGPPAYAARLTVLDAAAAQEGDVRRVHGDPSTERIGSPRASALSAGTVHVHSYVRMAALAVAPQELFVGLSW